METKRIAKKLLLGETCSNCQQYSPAEWRNGRNDDAETIPGRCKYWYGEASGWQWRIIPEMRTCEQWKLKE